jgi:hypothetical protein
MNEASTSCNNATTYNLINSQRVRNLIVLLLFDRITQHQTLRGRKQRVTTVSGLRQRCHANPTASLLAQNGQDDDHEVEQVQRLLKVIVAQGEHLEWALVTMFNPMNNMMIMSNFLLVTMLKTMAATAARLFKNLRLRMGQRLNSNFGVPWAWAWL